MEFLKGLGENWIGVLVLVVLLVASLHLIKRMVFPLLRRGDPPAKAQNSEARRAMSDLITKIITDARLMVALLLLLTFAALLFFGVWQAFRSPTSHFMEFLKGLGENWTGVIVLLVAAIVLISLFAQLMRIITFGAFAKGPVVTVQGKTISTDVSKAFSDFIIKIITEFRHLLALVIVLIFAFALACAIYIGRTGTDKLADALQAVTATLGGLVGGIIGYYFGESKAAGNTDTGTGGQSTTGPKKAEQELPDGTDPQIPEIKPIPPPSGITSQTIP